MVFAISFALYTLAIVGVGLYSARFARRSDEDYFLAGRSLGPWVAALSASASSESGWVTLGLVGWAFTTGYSAYWIIPGASAASSSTGSCSRDRCGIDRRRWGPSPCPTSSPGASASGFRCSGS